MSADDVTYTTADENTAEQFDEILDDDVDQVSVAEQSMLVGIDSEEDGLAGDLHGSLLG